MRMVSKRRGLAAALVLSALIVLPSASSGASKRSPKSRLKNIVVVMMENRSFDHLLGWHPTADARQADLAYPDGLGGLVPTSHLLDFQGCGHPEPDHSYDGGRAEVHDGAMDGFLTAGDNDAYALGYYVEEDRPFTSALARNFTTLDHWFASILGPTFPNRIFLHAAQTDRLDNAVTLSTLPTIWDRLAEKHVNARYYVSDISFLALWGGKYASIVAPYAQFLADAAAGKLPQVSFVEPRFLGDDIGIGGSDHPFSDIRSGDAFLERTFHAVASGPDWPSTVFIVTYDEWGGFFDHVAPPRAAAPNDVDPDVVGGKALLGLRVPAIIASPFTRGDPDHPRVVSTVFDHTSVLKLIEWRFGIAPLTARDASNDVGNLLDALDLDAFDAAVPDLPEVDPPPPHVCD
ncbi:MAG TPA: alkaline phosphatase family protein [Candidatus Polarisedimenticolia bacterium]|jgi:phospholipase C|nr:alkaline phosphatase family protein [Candidatus Polarisedimenticolia bacterium]